VYVIGTRNLKEAFVSLSCSFRRDFFFSVAHNAMRR